MTCPKAAQSLTLPRRRCREDRPPGCRPALNEARSSNECADADTTIVADLVQNGSFVINVQPSGTYTATLVFAGLTPIVEIGQLTVSGGFVTLRPNQTPPCPVAPQRYQFTRSDYLILGPGPTCFPFRPGELDPGQAYIELERR